MSRAPSDNDQNPDSLSQALMDVVSEYLPSVSQSEASEESYVPPALSVIVEEKKGENELHSLNNCLDLDGAHQAHEEKIKAYQAEIKEFNKPREEAKLSRKHEEKEEDAAKARARAAGRCALMSFSCRQSMRSAARKAPRVWEEKWLLLCGLGVIGALIYFAREAINADGYHAQPFHPGATFDDSINALGQENQDQYNLINNVWPNRNLTWICVAGVAFLFAAHLLNHFTSRRIRRENDETRLASREHTQILNRLQGVIVAEREVLQAQRRTIADLRGELEISQNRISRLEQALGQAPAAGVAQAERKNESSESSVSLPVHFRLSTAARGYSAGVTQELFSRLPALRQGGARPSAEPLSLSTLPSSGQ